MTTTMRAIPIHIEVRQRSGRGVDNDLRCFGAVDRVRIRD